MEYINFQGYDNHYQTLRHKIEDIVADIEVWDKKYETIKSKYQNSDLHNSEIGDSFENEIDLFFIKLYKKIEEEEHIQHISCRLENEKLENRLIRKLIIDTSDFTNYLVVLTISSLILGCFYSIFMPN